MGYFIRVPIDDQSGGHLRVESEELGSHLGPAGRTGHRENVLASQSPEKSIDDGDVQVSVGTGKYGRGYLEISPGPQL